MGGSIDAEIVRLQAVIDRPVVIHWSKVTRWSKAPFMGLRAIETQAHHKPLETLGHAPLPTVFAPAGEPTVKKRTGRARNASHKRGKIRERDGDHCHWCKKLMRFGGQRQMDSATIEHLMPASKGGPGTLENLVLACYRCNSRRGNKLGPPP